MHVANTYKVYVHTNLVTNKKYVGITRLPLQERFNNGKGYFSNKKFYKDIKKYGWNEGFSHEVIKDNLDYITARRLENELIKKYDLVNSGYNNIESNIRDIKIDFFDFKVFNTTNIKYKTDSNYFTRVPNMFIRCNLKKEFGISRIFLPLYILIDKNRTLEDISNITLGDILTNMGYKLLPHKPLLFYEILKCLYFLRENNYIDFDLSTDAGLLGYHTLIKIKIISENFDPVDNFSKITATQFNAILVSDSSINRENMLIVFLYINSYIGCRPRNNDGSELLDKPSDRPEAFYRSIEKMAKDLSMSKDTIGQCLNYLTAPSKEYNALLVKKEVGSIQPDKNKPPQNVPNIYVLNKENYEKEIEWAFQKMKEMYQVNEFE